MTLIEKRGSIEIYRSTDGEFAVYGVTASGDPRVCHSLGMAREIAG